MNPMEMLNNKIRDTDDRFTKREYIAAQMMQYLIAGKTISLASTKDMIDYSLQAIKIADILIHELRTKPAGALK